MTVPASPPSIFHPDATSIATQSKLVSDWQPQEPQCFPGWDPRILGMGGSAVVSAYDEKTVLKGYVVWLDGRRKVDRDHEEEAKKSLDREHEVYLRLGSHPHILEYFGQVEVEPAIFSLRLEHAVYRDLRSLIKANAPAPLTLRRRWAIDMADGLSHIHAMGVFHCDFSCRNTFLTNLDVVKIGDFGGAALDDKQPLAAEEPWYELPLRGKDWEERPYVKRELFALGCAIYEVMAWKKPFHSLDADEVEARYAREDFPDLTGMLGADIIRGCWRENFDSAQEVRSALESVEVLDL